MTQDTNSNEIRHVHFKTSDILRKNIADREYK